LIVAFLEKKTLAFDAFLAAGWLVGATG